LYAQHSNRARAGVVLPGTTIIERSGRLRREPHPHDRRKQVLRLTPEAVQEVRQVFEALPADPNELLEGFDAHRLAAIAEFLARATDFVYRRGALLRAQGRQRGRPGVPRASTRAAVG
jgi:hypothetical protein